MTQTFPEYPFRSHYYQAGPHRMHFIDEGQGPVVVMVHGNPTWSYYYRGLIQRLSVDHRVIAMDHIAAAYGEP